MQITTETAASIIGISDRQLRNLRTKGCPVPEGGVKTVEDIARIVDWRVEHEAREARDDLTKLMESMGEGSMDLLDYEEKRTSLKAKQLKLARELDLVLDRDEYMHHLSMLFSELNSLIDSMGAQLGPVVASISDPVLCADAIDDFVADIKKRFNAEEAMNPVRVDIDPFGDDDDGSAELEEDDDDDGVE